MINDYAISLGILGLVGTGITIVWKQIIKPKIDADLEKRNKIYWMVDQMFPMVQKVHSEVSYNGGTSIKDGILSLKKSVAKIEERIDGFENNYRLSINIQDVPFWESDETGNCVYASPALCKLLGRSESEIMSNGWMSWVHPEDRERVLDAWDDSVELKTAFDEIYRFKKGDNSWLKVWGTAFPLVTGKSNLAGKMGKLVVVE